MRIAIVGAGRIGSTFAFYLSRAGHDVTLVARGKRLDELTNARAITSVDGERVKVKAEGALDPAVKWDLVLVTVLAHQVDPVLPALTASAAKTVMFMFNTVESLARLREAVGAARFEFGFPTVTAFFVDGKLKSSVAGAGNVTTVSSEAWVKTFADAGIPSEHQPDMESFLRCHAAFVVPLMAIASVVYGRSKPLRWSEAKPFTRAMAEAFRVVRKLGNQLTPGWVAFLAKLPGFLVTLLLWSASRAAMVRDLGEFGPAEAQHLIDGFSKLAPGETPELLAIRPGQ